jgi:hypothetical protein
MTDQAIVNLKKKLDALSSKAPKGKVNTKLEDIPKQAPQYQMQPLQSPQPLPTQRKSVLGELSPEEIRSLKAQLGFQEPQEVP